MSYSVWFGIFLPAAFCQLTVYVVIQLYFWFNFNCHMWVEFVVSSRSRPCSEGFSPGSPVFLPPQKLTFLNSN